ncbi:ABC transporter ATP-binding protein [Clostridium tetani]|uniref:ABC transporter ATP-binding protein n=1 Tax=Clostridium tetani (strain Massachusetts / E88) TaxID=212717 RepID=Q899Y9_CLOTE|nr:ABC transporter ATP-binding protein [Clostridium tetani]AAO37420.1 ABC transporter ATP-binding protein [Clostridium tetani E88]KGI36365.1 bacitracin ABC transporter ATP-binding protein [Clostridium tetani]KHO30780.1 bacitracin ABC transporter ATP-binding protein [Clostridium tetani]KIG19767.1 bacitracin ABC transporter ATP-binding protein [Clostridium tetani]RXI60792.1 ABC transporter ATP-binding protein [Clostridium tetani]
MSILEVKDIEKIYSGKVNYTALNGVNFELEKGEFVAIMGPSGSGKTTLLNCVSTIDSPTRGEIIINNKRPHELDDDNLAKFRRQELGFVFQDFNLVNTLTVEENIILPLTLDSVSRRVMKDRLKISSNLLGIEKLLKKRTFEISGGQAQRVAIARSIIHEPSLLLADEPTGNLDSKAVKDVMELFVSINKKLNTTILMVTHDAYVASFCNRVIFIKDGKLYNEIHSGDSQSEFYEKIIDMLSFLGGGRSDIK